jgi:hypothetical protein
MDNRAEHREGAQAVQLRAISGGTLRDFGYDSFGHPLTYLPTGG